MTCGFSEDLTAYLDRELPDARVAALRSHLPACPGCRETLAMLEAAVAPLGALPAFQPSPELRRAVLRRIEEQSLAERLKAFFRPAVLVPSLALSAALVVAVVVSNRQGEDPELLLDPGGLELAANLEVLEDLDVLGVDSAEDLDVIEHLDELEAVP